MRPVERGPSPLDGDYGNFRDAFPELVSRLGPYCSYCERIIHTNLAVEHIQPKGLDQYQDLEGRWENFLLGCVNCNSTKRDKDVILSEVVLPDRDNTDFAFEYSQNGIVKSSSELDASRMQFADRLLALTGLDKRYSDVYDSNGNLVAIDRMAQRREVWSAANTAKEDLDENPTEDLRRYVVKLALQSGFFSIWMTVFIDDQDMRKRLIAAFPGTALDCFDQVTTGAISPRPSNGLEGAGKI